MMISTRGRYALRVLINLAENCNGKLIPMKDVAESEGISLKYLEKILPDLTKSGLVTSVHGKGGGYRLAKSATEIRVSEVLKLTEGDLVPVACLGCDAEKCGNADNCRTLPMWKKLNAIINDFFESYTIKDLMK